MPNKDDIAWFKREFGAEINAALAETPFDLDMLTALACQETGEIWPILRKKGLTRADILRLCVGDTLDRKSKFPMNSVDLQSRTGGPAMFKLGHNLLVEMAGYIQGYAGTAKIPTKFCHGYGIFQYDIQFFDKVRTGDFFLGGYADFGQALSRCLGELTEKLKGKTIGYQPGKPLSDLDKTHVAIAYNRGSYDPAKRLQQGYKPKGGLFYGDAYYNYLQLAKTVATPAAPVAPPPGEAPIAPPAPIAAEGDGFHVETHGGMLMIRSTPEKDKARLTANVVGALPSGWPVKATGDQPRNGFLHIETSRNGALLSGWVSTAFLVADPAATVPTPVAPQSAMPTTGVIAVYNPVKAGTVTKRTERANASSLNELNQPSRTGATPEALRSDLWNVVDWLAVDNSHNLRYRPGAGLTYCNIYAHDFCTLAGCYLPRVWWSDRAIADLSGGTTVAPRYGDTIDEQRANDLFRWLRDWGERFGWRQTGTLTKLQTAANLGGIGLIVARRKEEGRSGHIVVVVPEGPDHAAKWVAGEVIAPLQSQAGAVNFRYGQGIAGWWRDPKFAEFAFWVHA